MLCQQRPQQQSTPCRHTASHTPNVVQQQPSCTNSKEGTARPRANQPPATPPMLHRVLLLHNRHTSTLWPSLHTYSAATPPSSHTPSHPHSHITHHAFTPDTCQGRRQPRLNAHHMPHSMLSPQPPCCGYSQSSHHCHTLPLCCCHCLQQVNTYLPCSCASAATAAATAPAPLLQLPAAPWVHNTGLPTTRACYRTCRC